MDAGAKHIELIVVDAGRTSIQVIDDGKGMSETDARLAFERHATSKIRQAADLFSLVTMGFRGEALPSIAAVAQVKLRTRAADSDLGTCLTIEGGKVLAQDVEACPCGSNFEVSNLFFNVPARRRFLKSNQTELSNIVQEFQRVALVNPEIAFTLVSNGVTILSLPAENLKQRISSLFGKKISDSLLKVDVQTTMCNISGFVGKPESAKKRGALQYFFVNGRYMRHPYFHKAVLEAFDGLIPATEQVPYFLYFQLDPSSIDVNIHPTKTEIKFENEVAIWQIALSAVKEALGKFNAIPIMEFDADDIPETIPVYSPVKSGAPISAPRIQYDSAYNPFETTTKAKTSPAGWEKLYDVASVASSTTHGIEHETFVDTDTELFSTVESDTSAIERSNQHYQYRGQYIITAVKNGLMMIDQHRAHVRVLYDRYMEAMDGRSNPSQRLLFPELIELSAPDALLIEKVTPNLQSLGFEITDMGGGTFSIEAIPAGIDGINPQTVLHDILNKLQEESSKVERELLHGIALTLAREASIPTGQLLTQQEMEDLVSSLFASSQPNYTPTGKHIVAIIEHDMVAKMFK